ncbi:MULTISPECIES: esterase/lipase family protein [Rhodococcus]|uniref:esterase/lipase family protein n=1 Tax=Rhodococcus TaxID=1827 RepID=UPI00071D6FAD|nr:MULTISPECIES: hypothetical protein [Rhodococcus]KSU66880.1 hypothetical protein AS032_31995 [Rhodococcus qingshengii]SCC69725.1 hypothetical protein GA0061093_12949 [Rhodococcus qingshengii]
MHHSVVALEKYKGWTFYASSHSGKVKRLIVFVHGFGGNAIGTWKNFPDSGEREWWLEADMLFIGYKSRKENPKGVADRIRRSIGDFFPKPNAAALTTSAGALRTDITTEYEELFLVAHSLGGLIVRQALADAAQKWREDGSPAEKRPPILSAQTRMFSPASAGFQASGALGAMKAASSVWSAIEVFLRRAPAFSDLQPGSEVLERTRRRTEMYVKEPGCEALKARIVWANPDNVVITDRYDTDFVDESIDETSHTTVCKPRAAELAPKSSKAFEMPWIFIETGTTEES